MRSRIEKRREIRQNLLTAASAVGTGQALRQIGGGAQLAREYLGAEFGDRPRHSWMAAGLFAATVLLVATSLWNEAALAYGDGIRAADLHATGTYAWRGIAYLQNNVTYTLTTVPDHTSAAASPRCSGLCGSGAPCSSDGCGG